jgi:hypothetical protein
VVDKKEGKGCATKVLSIRAWEIIAKVAKVVVWRIQGLGWRVGVYLEIIFADYRSCGWVDGEGVAVDE